MNKILTNNRKPLPWTHTIKWWVGWLSPVFAYMLLCALLIFIAFNIAGCDGGWAVAGYELDEIQR